LLAATMTPEVAGIGQGHESAEPPRGTLRPAAPLSKEPPQGRPPVIVILVESFRRDLLHMDPTPIPNLRRIAGQSIVFDKAYAASSHSDMADLSVWYARYPLRSPTFARDYPVNAPWKGESAFAAYRAAGYHTAYISSQNERWGQMINWLRVPEVDHFFHSEDYHGDTWVNRDDRNGLVRYLEAKTATAGKVEDSETFRIAREWLDSLPDGGKRGFFLGINLQNTHFHYVVPEGSPEPFQPTVMDFPAVYYTWPESRVTDVRNRYLNAVYNLDAIIAGFVADLKRRGIWDECYFVVVGDSGEAFYEHGFGNHSGPAFDEVMRTFTFIKPPHAGRGTVVQKPISHIDVIPTVMGMMAMEVPASMQGVPFAQSPPSPRIFMVVAAMVKQTSVLHWPWKLMLNHYPALPPQLFNLEEDPAEKHNQAARRPEILESMDGDLRAWHGGQFSYYARPEIFTKYGPPRWH
jgi:arylsulfatase A-like enzyme